MKHYKIVYPDSSGNHCEEVLSERDIIKDYFDHWSEGMVRVGKGNSISYENCIEDWKMVPWAEEVT